MQKKINFLRWLLFVPIAILVYLFISFLIIYFDDNKITAGSILNLALLNFSSIPLIIYYGIGTAFAPNYAKYKSIKILYNAMSLSLAVLVGYFLSSAYIYSVKMLLSVVIYVFIVQLMSYVIYKQNGFCGIFKPYGLNFKILSNGNVSVLGIPLSFNFHDAWYLLKPNHNYYNVNYNDRFIDVDYYNYTKYNTEANSNHHFHIRYRTQPLYNQIDMIKISAKAKTESDILLEFNYLKELSKKMTSEGEFTTDGGKICKFSTRLVNCRLEYKKENTTLNNSYFMLYYEIVGRHMVEKYENLNLV